MEDQELIELDSSCGVSLVNEGGGESISISGVSAGGGDGEDMNLGSEHLIGGGESDKSMTLG